MSIETGEQLFAFSSAAIRASSQNEIWDHLKATFSTFGVQFVNYAYGTSDDMVMFSNMAPAWLTYYSEHYGGTDYLVKYCSESAQTLHMDASHFNGEANIDLINANMMNDIWEQGSRGGLSVPVPKPNSNYLAGTGIFFGLSVRDSRDVVTRHGEEISLIMNTMHQFMSSFELERGEDIYSTRSGKHMAKQDLLTVREKDVLRYLTLGLRPDRIAEKMGLQLATIYMHIRKARRRLGAATREQAIAKAISRRHIVL